MLLSSLLLILLCCSSLASSVSTARCKKDINKIFPHGYCGNFDDCYNCNEAEGCGWCGGAGCGITKPGCYNQSEKEGKKKRHGDEVLCGAAEGDEWLHRADMCTFCEQYQSCSLCLNAPLPGWDRRDALCIWCDESRSCRRGSATSGPFYRRDTCPTYRWQRGFGECANYVRCEEQSSCFLCTKSYAGLNSPCHWCPDASVPWTNDEEGGGRCHEGSNSTCASHMTTDLLACPQRPGKVTQPPTDAMDPHFVRINSVLGAGLLLMLVSEWVGGWGFLSFFPF